MDCYKGGCIPPGQPRPPPPPEREGSIKVEAVDAPALAKHDSSILDLAFVMDCTGSMSSYIETAQQVRLISPANSVCDIYRNIFIMEISLILTTSGAASENLITMTFPSKSVS